MAVFGVGRGSSKKRIAFALSAGPYSPEVQAERFANRNIAHILFAFINQAVEFFGANRCFAHRVSFPPAADVALRSA
jgi:hypothetical protein